PRPVQFQFHHELSDFRQPCCGGVDLDVGDVDGHEGDDEVDEEDDEDEVEDEAEGEDLGFVGVVEDAGVNENLEK
ncbi:hypothetical protein HK104_005984, partial [Borealophlyctis nickersoniae]